ncbi:MAG: putative Cytochrome c subfamily [Bacteriovoracaceae bacterium]|nr:putative Cytochrome c subfamily [Bacteriovoracaceae bacterium]
MEHKKDDKHKHHILSNKLGLRILISLLVLTLITVVASRIDFGSYNFPIAMFIASGKALLVVLFFMGMKYDDNQNRIIFFSSLFFVAVFFLLTASDVFTRHVNWRARGPILMEVTGGVKFKKPWIPTPELIAHGKEVFSVSCVACHGSEGLGNGAAAAALNPKPRNFHEEAGWKNGRKPTDVFLTLKNGVPGSAMASFEGTLSAEDRWSLVHYVLSLGPTQPSSDTDDLKKVGITDPSKDDGGIGGGEKPQRKIPIGFAIDRYVSKAK